MTKRTDIERLLQWAFREELPKGRPVDQAPSELRGDPWLGGLWVRVDGGGQKGHGLVPGEPHPDAVAIERAVLALDRAFSFSAAECADLLGIYAAGHGARAIEAVAGAPYNLALLTVRCAMLNALEWDVGTPRARPVTRPSTRHPVFYGLRQTPGAFGVPMVEVVEVKADKNGRWPAALAVYEPRGDVVYEEPSLGELLEARAEYTAWHRAMVQVVAAVAGKLVDHAALPPARPCAPWITGDAKPATVLAAPPAAGVRLRKLPLAPRRGIVAGPPIEAPIEKLTRERREGAAKERQRTARVKRAANRGLSDLR